MDVVWGTFKGSDGTTCRQINVSKTADWTLFDQLASELKRCTKGHWVAQLDGFDQRYWDLASGTAKVTLHLEHYLGITVYPADGAQADPDSVALLESAFRILEEYEPA